ncbi:hypothetical protein DXG03_000685 [Asterophora parasitica]|uniref:Asl1-like glycosyl hydrolase catalytic domain-containing protein n=1 Tax=Asterophora parasitica TaxID=117018 RepID=A0A9P7KBX8_9AGAR|nr:hypothetical protein DXG03_000685 [Asterophora parasitica]
MFFFRVALWSSSAFLLVSAQNKTSKRGLAFSSEQTPGDLNNANQTKSHISWQYDWGNSPPAYIAVSNIEYIPMQWGTGKIEQFADAVAAQGAKTILAFNEPDFDKESNMLATDAAKLWKQYLEPLKAKGIRLGGPAVTGSPTGRPWLAEFFEACTKCSVDFLPIHWYGEGTEGFYNYLWEVHNQFPKLPIWVTEYASTSKNETGRTAPPLRMFRRSRNTLEVAEFLNATITYMDTLDWIERYAWFGFFRPREDAIYNLLGDDGGLNKLGQIYVGAKTTHTQIVSKAPTKSYHTVNGADLPSQGIVTTYASVANAAVRGWNAFGIEERRQAFGFGLSLVVSALGAVCTIW